MKKIIALIMSVLLCIAVPSVSFAQNEPEIRILCLGEYLEPDVAPFYADSRIMAPVRAVFESVGAEVVWDDTLKKATGKKGDDVVSLTLGSNVIEVNGESVIMDTVLIEKDSRVFAPIRFVAESFGYSVSYHDASNTAVISANRKYEFYDSITVALPLFDGVTGAEFIRSEKNDDGSNEFYYTYNEDYATDYFNALQSDFGYILENIYFQDGAHIYEYVSESGHIVKVADYYNSDDMICIVVTPDIQSDFSDQLIKKNPADIYKPDTDSDADDFPDTKVIPGDNPLDYGAVTGSRLIEARDMDGGTTIYRYEYNSFAHMVYESFLSSKGWYFYDFNFDMDKFMTTTYYTDGDKLISVTQAYMLSEIWIIYP